MLNYVSRVQFASAVCTLFSVAQRDVESHLMRQEIMLNSALAKLMRDGSLGTQPSCGSGLGGFGLRNSASPNAETDEAEGASLSAIGRPKLIQILRSHSVEASESRLMTVLVFDSMAQLPAFLRISERLWIKSME